VVEITQPPRSLAYPPLYQVALAWQNTPEGTLNLPGLEVMPLSVRHVTAKFDLSLSLQEEDQRISGSMEFATALFDRETALRYLEYWRTFLEAMAAGLDGPAAEGKDLKVNLVLSDTKESFVLWIENAVLHYKKSEPAADANATLTLTKPIFIRMMAGTAGIKDFLFNDDLKIDGSKIDLIRFLTLIDKAPGTFAIVTSSRGAI